MEILPCLNSDSYKQFHVYMYPKNLKYLYSNMTARKSRLPNVDKSVWFGLQGYLKEYLIYQWNKNFFNKPWERVEREYKRFHKHFSGVENIDASHWKQLHDLGYLPIRIKALPEGMLVPIRVPFMTITNTHQNFAWLVNFLETQISTCVWDLTVNATIANEYRKVFDHYALKTTGSTEGVQWQGHDFSMRGRSSMESCLNQMGHLLSFTGSDTIPAVLALEEFYNADMEKELIAMSVPASEHSVMMCLGKEGEIRTFRHLLDQFPKGILSVVSDTWNLWDVLTDYLPKLKEEILARDGKLVIRPDSGNPVDIICGNLYAIEWESFYERKKWIDEERTKRNISLTREQLAAEKGVVELLWDTFGGTTNEQGYKVLNPKVGCIYGDAITLERAVEINERLMKKGFASINWVAGIGSYTYNYNTRDTLGIAVKATHCTLDNNGTLEHREIFKDPITDSGEKKSAKGLIKVYEENGEVKMKDQCSFKEEEEGLLVPVFEDGLLLVDWTLQEVRNRLENERKKYSSK